MDLEPYSVAIARGDGLVAHIGHVLMYVADSTGASALRAVSAIRAMGGTVVGVLAVVDREEGGREALEAEGLPVAVLTTATQITNRMS